MNKYLVTLLIFALLLCSLLGCTTVAQASTDDSASDIHLVNPSSVAVIGDTLYIADNVTNTSCVVLQFDLSGTTPLYSTMTEYSGNITLMRSYYDILYIIQADSYMAYDTTTTTTTTVNSSISDIAIFQYNNLTYTYTIANGTVYRGSANKGWTATSIAISQDDQTLYLLCGQDDATVSLVEDNQINESYNSGSNNSYTNISVLDNMLVQYDSTTATVDGTLLSLELSSVESITCHNGSLLILAGNTLTQYTTTDNITYTSGYIVGSDTVSVTEPELDSITEYTLAVSIGYPTNIVYKTTGDNSIAELVELSNEQILILGYSGSDNASYYYVYTESGFGWIKKGADSLAEESTLTTIDSSINGNVTYTAKLISPYSVTIYSLPSTSYVRTTFTQSASEPTTVSLLSQITDSASTTWYYISYTLEGATQYGYVKSGDVGYIYSSGTTGNVVLDSDTPYMKIDSTLQGDVYMYLTSELTSGTELVDSSDNIIVLEGNTRVSVITVGESSSYIQVTTDNGTYYGWVDNDCLISTSALTTSTVVGLILLGVALILIVATVVIIKTRKNNLVSNDIL